MAARTNPTGVVLGLYGHNPLITVAKANPQGAVIGDAVTISADMGIWDTVNNCFVTPEQTTVGINQ